MIITNIADIIFRKFYFEGGIFVSIEQISNAGMQQHINNIKSSSSENTISDRTTFARKEATEKNENEARFKPSEKQIQEAVDSTNREFEKLKTNLRFSVHKQTKQIMVKIIDSNTQEVIKELPPEKLLDMVASMMERAGLIVDRRG